MPSPSAADADRRRLALELLDASAPAFRATARRFSLCAADADDAYQRATEILLTKAPLHGQADRLAAWMQVVTRREALAVRRARERMLGAGGVPDLESLAALAACDGPSPAERLDRRERARGALALLARLKPAERRALVLQAQGYSYAEISEICGWTYTKVNRCLTEGRARLRELAAPHLARASCEP